jgi:hypothetical protein
MPDGSRRGSHWCLDCLFLARCSHGQWNFETGWPDGPADRPLDVSEVVEIRPKSLGRIDHWAHRYGGLYGSVSSPEICENAPGAEPLANSVAIQAAGLAEPETRASSRLPEK